MHHPQTNGKIERFFGLLDAKKKLFRDVDELIEWYSYDKPHMSLDFDNAETPEEAFWRKLTPERIFEYVGGLLICKIIPGYHRNSVNSESLYITLK